MGCLLRKAANREWSQFKKKKCVAVLQSTKLKGVGDLKSTLNLDKQIMCLEFAHPDFGLAVVQYSLIIFLPIWNINVFSVPLYIGNV